MLYRWQWVICVSIIAGIIMLILIHLQKQLHDQSFAHMTNKAIPTSCFGNNIQYEHEHHTLYMPQKKGIMISSNVTNIIHYETIKLGIVYDVYFLPLQPETLFFVTCAYDDYQQKDIIPDVTKLPSITQNLYFIDDNRYYRRADSSYLCTAELLRDRPGDAQCHPQSFYADFTKNV